MTTYPGAALMSRYRRLRRWGEDRALAVVAAVVCTVVAFVVTFIQGTYGVWTAADSNAGNILVTGKWAVPLQTWGYALDGETGVNLTTTSSTTAVRMPGAEQWSVVSAGMYWTCGVTVSTSSPANALYCWGANASGQLGTGNLTSYSTPKLISSGWSTVSAGGEGNYFTCGLTTSQLAYCWGDDTYGQIGNGTSSGNVTTPTAVTTTGTQTWSQISVGKYAVCGIKTDSTLWCWGGNTWGQVGNNSSSAQTTPVQIGTSSSWASVDASEHGSVCAITTTNALYCWGYNGSNQLGSNGTTNMSVPTQVAFGGSWKSVATGVAHTCAVTTTGALYCWGSNANGDLGNNSTATPTANTDVQENTAAINWSSVVAGNNFTCAQKTTGALYCWGINGLGQLGVGSTADSWVPVAAGSMTDWNSISAGWTTLCGIRVSDNGIWCQGDNSNNNIGAYSSKVTSPSPVQPPTSSVWANGNESNTDGCGVRGDGTLWCWGLNGNGQDGNGNVGVNYFPVQESTAATNWASVSLGHLSTCAIKASGALYCWGYGGFYQFGTGSVVDSHSPIAGPTGTWSQVSVGYSHTCAITTAGALYCWGLNASGQDGSGNITTQQTPYLVSVSGVTGWSYVSAGYNDTCAVSSSTSTYANALYCWGDNTDGQLGNGSSGTNVTSPARVGTAQWLAIAVGYYTTCGIQGTSGSGTMWCWGQNETGEVGNGSSGSNVLTPTQVGSASNWVSVATASHAAGYAVSCATQTDRSIWCWGDNTYGQLGDRNPGTDQYLPQKVPNATATTVRGHGDASGMIAWA